MSDFKYTPKNSVKAYWVKKKVTKTQWNTIYLPGGSHCLLSRDKDGVWIGFIVALQVPYDCEIMNDEELRQTDEFCRARNIRPFPLDDVPLEKEVEKNKIETNPEFPPDFELPLMEF